MMCALTVCVVLVLTERMALAGCMIYCVCVYIYIYARHCRCCADGGGDGGGGQWVGAGGPDLSLKRDGRAVQRPGPHLQDSPDGPDGPSFCALQHRSACLPRFLVFWWVPSSRFRVSGR